MPFSAPVDGWLTELRERFATGVRSCAAEAQAVVGPHLREAAPIVSDEHREDGVSTLTVQIGRRRLVLETRVRDGRLSIEADTGASPRSVTLAPGITADGLEEVVWDLLYPTERIR